MGSKPRGSPSRPPPKVSSTRCDAVGRWKAPRDSGPLRLRPAATCRSMSTAELFAMDWSPDSWRQRPAEQQPDWPDADAMGQVETELRHLPPLVFAGEARTLTESLAAAQ